MISPRRKQATAPKSAHGTRFRQIAAEWRSALAIINKSKMDFRRQSPLRPMLKTIRAEM